MHARIVGIAVALMVLGLILAACGEEGQLIVTPTPTLTREPAIPTPIPTQEPATPIPTLTPGVEVSFPEVTPFPPSLQETLHAIRDRVAAVRGLAVNDQVVEGVVSRQQLRQYIDENLAKLDEEDRRELEAFNIALRLMHMIGPEDDFLEIVAQFYSEEILGLYVFDEDRLVLIAEVASIEGEDELTLAHEYVHSFQDGSFDTERLEKLAEEEEDDSSTEYSTTISCLQEGDATLSSILYAEDVYGPDWVEMIFPPSDEEEAAESEETLPPAIERHFKFDYRECVRFVASLYREGGWGAVDNAYEDPPWTTEQILHPDKYASRENATSMAPVDLSEHLGRDWEQLDLATFGEFDVYNYLLTILGEDKEGAATAAASGWGSGWISVYEAEKGGSTQAQDVLVHIALEWDSHADFLDFMTVYEKVVKVISNGNWQAEGDDGPMRWQGEGEYGYVAWDEERTQVHVIIATDEEAVEAAARGLPV